MTAFAHRVAPSDTSGRILPGPMTRTLALAGGVACLAALAAAWVAPEDAIHAWIGAAFFWTSLPIGGLLLLMMMRLIPGIWSNEAMVVMEAASVLVPLAALVFVPVLLGLGAAYPWVGETQNTAFRQIYLSPGFFVARTVLWFVLLGALTALLIVRRPWSMPLACLGLVLFPLGGTVIVTDWLMTLDPEFRSSGFGLYAMSIQAAIAMAAGTATALAISGAMIRKPAVLGGLLLTVLLLWAYFAYMQYVVIWSSDFPKLIDWYKVRGTGIWRIMLWSFAIVHTAAIALLILPPVLRRRRLLIGIALAVLAGKMLEVAWIVLPAGKYGPGMLAIGLFVLANAGLGAIFIVAASVAIQARIAARVPKRRPGGGHG